MGIKKSCKHKRLLKLLTLRTKNDILNQHYKKYENILKKSVAIAKKQHYKKRISYSSNKVKAMWSVVNEYTNRKNKKENNNIKLNINNNILNNRSKADSE